ncbi:large ribosomal subunit protein bL33m isoform X1 [Tursiops truncatus]|uniref:large ribosomal subunit protein bL33m isoform X1 n=1 Tax=Tursiops truncatus TaxID=9739 RepID=UPI003CCF480C
MAGSSEVTVTQVPAPLLLSVLQPSGMYVSTSSLLTASRLPRSFKLATFSPPLPTQIPKRNFLNKKPYLLEHLKLLFVSS